MTSAPRIVSLVPSVTELLIDMGLGPWLVGRTGFCIHPSHALRSIAKVGGTKDIHLAKIRQLAPTHVVVNVDENTLPAVQALQEFVPHVIVTHPRTPLDNIALIDQLLHELAAHVSAANAIRDKACVIKQGIVLGLQKLGEMRPRPQQVLYLVWRDPWMTVARDTYISQMLALIAWQTWPDVDGGEKGAARYPAIAGDEQGLQQVQRVLLPNEPYRFDMSHLPEIKAWLPHAKVQFVDGEMLSWYGSRSVQGLAYLAELLASDISEAASSA